MVALTRPTPIQAPVLAAARTKLSVTPQALFGFGGASGPKLPGRGTSGSSD